MESYRAERVKAHTISRPAKDTDDGLYLVMRRVDAHLEDLGLSQRDLQLLQEAKTNNSAIVPLFRPIGEQMEKLLQADPVDAITLGGLLMEAAATEKQFKSDRYRGALAELSDQGRAAIARAERQFGEDIEVRHVDYRSLAADQPDYVIELAQRFVSSMQGASDAPRQPESKMSPDGQWRSTLR